MTKHLGTEGTKGCRPDGNVPWVHLEKNPSVLCDHIHFLFPSSVSFTRQTSLCVTIIFLVTWESLVSSVFPLGVLLRKDLRPPLSFERSSYLNDIIGFITLVQDQEILRTDTLTFLPKDTKECKDKKCHWIYPEK